MCPSLGTAAGRDSLTPVRLKYRHINNLLNNTGEQRTEGSKRKGRRLSVWLKCFACFAQFYSTPLSEEIEEKKLRKRIEEKKL